MKLRSLRVSKGEAHIQCMRRYSLFRLRSTNNYEYYRLSRAVETTPTVVITTIDFVYLPHETGRGHQAKEIRKRI
jgi:hypothetical protein